MAEFSCPTWDGPGRCECGAELPPMKDWIGAGLDWSHVACSTCGLTYVDEEEFVAIYPRCRYCKRTVADCQSRGASYCCSDCDHGDKPATVKAGTTEGGV